MRKRTSSGERFQFSVENAYADTHRTPSSMAPSTTSNSELSPSSWPAVRGSPRSCAQRPLPSMTIGDVPRDEVGRQGRRSRAGRVRRRRADLGAGRRGGAAPHVRSTSGRLRRPRSRCHCRWAATRPLASRRVRGSLASAGSHEP